MSQQILMTVHGHPRPQPRPRFINGRVVSTADQNAKLWRAAVMTAAGRLHGMAQIPVKVPTKFSMAFVFPTDKAARHGKPHAQVPDLDNLAKLILDAMQDAGVLENDSLVSSLELSKSWGPKGGVMVLIEGDIDSPADLLDGPEWLDGGEDTPNG
jgi:Holliday junction resolvase RusA-like endonuclease